MYLCITERNTQDLASNALLCKVQCLLRIPMETIGKQKIKETKVHDRNDFFEYDHNKKPVNTTTCTHQNCK